MADTPADKKITEPVGKNEAVVGTAAEYAAYYNFGTRNQDAHPFLSAAGEIVGAKLKGYVSVEQQLAMVAEIGSSFDKQRAAGIEIIRYGSPEKAVAVGTKKALIKAAQAISTQAKSLINNQTGYLRNSVMYKVDGEPDGGFNKH